MPTPEGWEYTGCYGFSVGSRGYEMFSKGGKKFLIERPFKINDRLYEAEEWAWYIGPNNSKHPYKKSEDSLTCKLIRCSDWQPASTMPIELAENFKIITGQKVESFFDYPPSPIGWNDAASGPYNVGAKKIWQWALETKEG